MTFRIEQSLSPQSEKCCEKETPLTETNLHSSHSSDDLNEDFVNISAHSSHKPHQKSHHMDRLTDGTRTRSRLREARFAFDELMTRSIVNPLRGLEDWSVIIQGLLLGVIARKEDAKELHKQYPKLTVVFQVVESFEKAGKGFFKNVPTAKVDDWEKLGIRCYQVPVRDYTADVEARHMYEAIQEMHKEISAGNIVYVHCKAGKSRSATLVACYLAIYQSGEGKLFPENVTPEQIYEFLLTRRAQVKLSDVNLQVIAEVQKLHAQNLVNINNNNHVDNNTTNSHIHTTNSLKETIKQFVATEKSKQAVSLLPGFAKLKEYAQEKGIDTTRATYIKLFQNAMAIQDNSNWFTDLFNHQGPIEDLLQHRPGSRLFCSGESKRRLTIVNQFKNEILELISKELNCPLEQLIKLYHPKALQNNEAHKP